MPETVTRGVSAIFNTRHYGYFADLIRGVENTKLKATRFIDTFGFLQSPIKVNSFGSDIENPTEPEDTMCSNLDEYSRIFGPYIDYSFAIQLEPDANRREAIEGFVYASISPSSPPLRPLRRR